MQTALRRRLPSLLCFNPSLRWRSHVHRAAGAVVGRQAEQEAIQPGDGLRANREDRGVTVEGEPGIGKTRLLLAAGEMASAAGFTTIAVTADEELRGPFLLARSILGSPEAIQAAGETTRDRRGARALPRLDVRAGRPGPRDACRPIAGSCARSTWAPSRSGPSPPSGPLAVLIDDLQWADDDSLRLLRYVVRSDATSPIFLMFAIRPEELALVTEAVNLIADMDRMGLRPPPEGGPLGQVGDAGSSSRQVLGGPVDASGAAVMHAQAEGVPFIVEEMARAYRDGGDDPADRRRLAARPATRSDWCRPR